MIWIIGIPLSLLITFWILGLPGKHAEPRYLVTEKQQHRMTEIELLEREAELAERDKDLA